jgi:2-polyprenyl-3-methyl-5-hydroxy-6-metoxy-1,4-benzoquinol methylase
MIAAGLANRQLGSELMDQPGLEAHRHRRALRALVWLNRFSFTSRALWAPIAELARAIPERPIRILDIASGGGDVAVGLWRRARRARIAVEIDGCDRSPVAVEFANQRARQQRANAWFFPFDVVEAPLPAGYDVITCSLFLHHLSDREAANLLRRMSESARRMVLISDLVRSARGYLWAWLGTRLVTRSDVVRTDGPMSVAAAFTIDEITRLAHESGLIGATVTACWPERFLLVWRRSAPPT